MLDWIRTRALENPVLGRQLATVFTGPRVGMSLLGSNVVLVALMLGLFSHFAADLRPDAAVAPGAELWYWECVAIYFVLTLVIPIHVAGQIEGARVGRAFDQVVVTGASPLALHLGSWSGAVLFASVLLVGTLPFAAFSVFLGGVSVGTILAGYAALWCYVHVIAAVSLALVPFEREWVTTPAAIAIFALLGAFGAVREPEFLEYFPPHLAELSPLRLIARFALETDAARIATWGDMATPAPSPWFFGVEVPTSLYTALAWTWILAMAVFLFTTGPAHRFESGFDNFQSVVLPGDRKKRFRRRLRATFLRRVQVAFLYENRPRWCAAWEFPIKLGATVVLAILAFGAIQGLIYGPQWMPRRSFFNDELFLLSLLMAGFVIGAWILHWCDPRYRTRWTERIGPIRVPRELAIAAGFAVLAATVTWTWGEFLFASFRGAPEITSALPNEDLDEYFQTAGRFVPGVVLFLVVLFLASRLLSRVSQSLILARLLTTALAILLSSVPMAIFALSRETGRIPPSFEALGGFSWAFLIDEMFSRYRDDWPPEKRAGVYFTIQSAMALFLSAWIVASHVMVARKRRRAAGRAAGGPGGGSPGGAANDSPDSGGAPGAGGATTTVALLLVALAIARPASAQPVVESDAPPAPTAELRVLEAVRGFDGRVFAPDIDFMTVVVSNPTSETIRGSWWIEGDRSDWKTSRRPLEIGPGTTRRVTWRLRSQDPGPYGGLELRWVFTDASGGRAESVPCRRQEVQAWEPSSDDPELRHSYLYVGRQTSPPAEWFQHAMSRRPELLVECRHISLPGDVRPYLGVSAVFVERLEFKRWNEDQRLALLDWVRGGGSVFFHGGLVPLGLPEDSPWTELLRVRESSPTETGGASLAVEKLVDGWEGLEVDPPGPTEPIALLSTRALGAGRISHLAFDPANEAALPDWVDRDAFWSRFPREIPTSLFPLVVERPQQNDSHLVDLTSLVLALAYFVGYTLIIGAGTAWAFRSRERRVKLWMWVPAAALCGAAGVPLLSWVLEASPSPGELREVIWHGPRGDRATVLAHLHVRSSGRHRHRLSVAGDRVVARHHSTLPRYRYYHYQPPGYTDPPELDDIVPLELGEDRAEIRLATRPWAAIGISLLADVRRTAPVVAQATIASALGGPKLVVRATFADEIPADLSILPLGLRPSEAASLQLTPVPASARSGREVLMPMTLDLTSHRQMGERRWFEDLSIAGAPLTHRLRYYAQGTPRVLLVWHEDPGATGGLDVRTEDVRFRPPVPPGEQPVELVERLIVVEVPLVITESR